MFQIQSHFTPQTVFSLAVGKAVTDPYSALTSVWRSFTHFVISWNSACAWPTSAFHRAVTAPSTLQHWYPQPQSQMQCSQTACPTRSTWLSSKPRLPVPKTFTLPCWTVPTRSLARLPHPRLALEAASEGLVEGGAENEVWPEGKQMVPVTDLFVLPQ